MNLPSRDKVIAVLVCAIAAVASLGPIACGGGDQSDEDQIRGVIEQALTTRDTSNCEETATDNFIQTFYGGSIDACKQDVESGETAESVEVTGIEIDGDAASAEVIPTGGDNDGQPLGVELVNQNGEWLIDDAVLGGRSNQLTELFFQSIRQQVLDRGLSGEVADCIEQQLRDSITPEELEALKAGDRPGSVSQKAKDAGENCEPGAAAK